MIEDLRNVIVNVSRETRMTNFDKHVLGNDAENLQGYIVFKFDDEFVDGVGRLEYDIDGVMNYIMLTKEDECYYMPVKNIITKHGTIYMQLVITENSEDDSIPVFKSNKFYVYVGESINAVEEAPEGYDLWIEVANKKLLEVDSKLSEVDAKVAEVQECIDMASEAAEYATEKGDYAEHQGNTAKEIADEAKAVVDSVQPIVDKIKQDEEERKTNERIRVQNETIRQEQEEVRNQNEESRIINERDRETTFAQYERIIEDLSNRLDEYDKYDYLVIERGNE